VAGRSPWRSEDWLRQIGPPMRVAALSPQKYLIGHRLPTYLLVLRLACFWPRSLFDRSAAQIAAQTPSWAAVSEAVLRVRRSHDRAAWVTLIFAAIEFTATHYPAKCHRSPGLGRLDAWHAAAMETEAAGEEARSFAHALRSVFGFSSWVGGCWFLGIRIC